MARPILFVACLALLPGLVVAQQRGVMPVARPAPVVMRPSAPIQGSAQAVARPVLRIPAGAMQPNRTVGSQGRPVGIIPRSGHSPIRVMQRDRAFDQSSDFPVPGLGFDAVHFAATHPQGIKHREPETSFFIPFLGGGYYVPYPAVNEEVAPPAVEQVEYVPVEEWESSRHERPVEAAPIPNPAHEESAQPRRDTDEYVFVRRDGTVFFAVAYLWDRQGLRYITREGLRQNVSSEALDLDATRQFNEQRGLSFRSPV